MKTLKDWQDVVKREVPDIDIKPYSHNIIGLALSAIASEFGKDEANRLIRKHKLNHRGWHEVD